MKKALTILSLLTLACAGHAASSGYGYQAGQFSFNDGTLVDKELNYAFIVDMTKNTFNNFSLNIGNQIQAGTYLDAGTNNYYTIEQGSLQIEDGVNYASGEFFVYGTQYGEGGFSGGEDIGILVWTNAGKEIADGTVKEGYYYAVCSLSKTAYETSLNYWQIPQSGDLGKSYEMYALAQNWPEGGELSNSSLTLSKQAAPVPEPATCAAIFGALALALAAWRKKR
ncbi:MAG: hypothetical protein J6P03_05870 [Opitutales bacterium]|nr:hypothetical protein [Opitutales bacterium]